MVSTLLLSSLIGTALAQSTSVTSFFFAAGDVQSLVASVVSADATATTFEMTCPSDVDGSDCGFRPPVHVVNQNQNTWITSLATAEPDFTYAATCTVSETLAVCAESAAGSEANFPGSSTETYTLSETDEYGYISVPVTITAGLEKLADATQAGAPTGTMATATSESGAMGTPASRTGTGSVPTETGAGVQTRAGLVSGMLVALTVAMTLA
ncbi:hypothetical protein EJ05DRAFT_230939 [Pseudovirgaria hyperparasitica]|uniref:GPI anchored protein n=1 Tax=Pseudovirgaria hyperparasitica TaxID=470096 RepID=A0A6A6VUX9_9PEZI|nr:uncharacterized protein EJ05DRAFT_230939 [Pseudovirgaria hyperparasitica]KAF2753051.1 hypothetical protein EJ05DRAFT_230939 [Pseudovirgaria hyperparasitica]